MGSNITRTALSTSSWLHQSFMGLIQPSAATVSDPGSGRDSMPLAPLGTAACGSGGSSSGGSSAGEGGQRRGGWFGANRDAPGSKSTQQPPSPVAHSRANGSNGNNGSHSIYNGTNKTGASRGSIRKSDSWNEDSNRPLDPGFIDRSTWHGKVPALVRSGSMIINHSDPTQTYLLNLPLQPSHDSSRGNDVIPTPLDLIDFSVEPRASWTPPSLSSAAASAGNGTPRESYGSGSRSGTEPLNNTTTTNNIVNVNNAGSRSGAEPWSATFSPMMRGATVVAAHAQQTTSSAPDLLDFNSPLQEVPQDLLPAGLSSTKWT